MMRRILTISALVLLSVASVAANAADAKRVSFEVSDDIIVHVDVTVSIEPNSSTSQPTTKPTPEPNPPVVDSDLSERIARAADGLWLIRQRFGASKEYVGWPLAVTVDAGERWYANEAGAWCNGKLMTIQPPGTPGIGYAYVKAYQVTGNDAYLRRAQVIGDTLLSIADQWNGGWHQDLCYIDGRWHYAMAWAGKRWDYTNAPAGHAIHAVDKGAVTLDDGTSQAAALFLLRLYQAGGGQRYLDGAKRFGDLLVDLRDCRPAATPTTAPYRAGGIPQVLPFDVAWQIVFPNEKGTPGEHYYVHKTLNDKTTSQAILFLIELWKVTGDDRYRECVRLQVDYLLARFAAEGNRGWCQQYDWKTDEPAWGRHKEPPAICSGEHEIPEALLAWYVLEDDAARRVKIAEVLRSHLLWFRDVATRSGDIWYRYYDGKPIWADGFKLVAEDNAASGQPWTLADPRRWIGKLMPEGDTLDLSSVSRHSSYWAADGIFGLGGASIDKVKAGQAASGLWPKSAKVGGKSRKIVTAATSAGYLCELCKEAVR
jgi:hypothetical protein